MKCAACGKILKSVFSIWKGIVRCKACIKRIIYELPAKYAEQLKAKF